MHQNPSLSDTTYREIHVIHVCNIKYGSRDTPHIVSFIHSFLTQSIKKTQKQNKNNHTNKRNTSKSGIFYKVFSHIHVKALSIPPSTTDRR